MPTSQQNVIDHLLDGTGVHRATGVQAPDELDLWWNRVNADPEAISDADVAVVNGLRPGRHVHLELKDVPMTQWRGTVTICLGGRPWMDCNVLVDAMNLQHATAIAKKRCREFLIHAGHIDILESGLMRVAWNSVSPLSTTARMLCICSPEESTDPSEQEDPSHHEDPSDREKDPD